MKVREGCLVLVLTRQEFCVRFKGLEESKWQNDYWRFALLQVENGAICTTGPYGKVTIGTGTGSI
jgi:hypothetical protein